MTTNTTDNGVLNNATSFEMEDAADALLNRWSSEETPSDKGEEVKKEEEDEAQPTEETDDEESSEDSEDQSEDTDGTEGDESSEDESDSSDEDTDEAEDEEDESELKKTPKVLDDDAEVEITVDKEVRKVTVKDLKRLYGQEASLTKKSQQVAAQRKDAEAQAAKLSASLDVLYNRAKTRWEPYSKVDMLLASKELSTEEFAALRKEAQESFEEFQFVSQEADKFMQQMESQRKETQKTKAAEAVTVLKEKIPNWSNELYDKIRKFAIDNGFDPAITSQIVDPAAIIMINKARLYEEGKKVVLKKKIKTPTKVLKSSKTTAEELTPSKSKVAMERLRKSGDTEDAMEAFMARWAQ